MLLLLFNSVGLTTFGVSPPAIRTHTSHMPNKLVSQILSLSLIVLQLNRSTRVRIVRRHREDTEAAIDLKPIVNSKNRADERSLLNKFTKTKNKQTHA